MDVCAIRRSRAACLITPEKSLRTDCWPLTSMIYVMSCRRRTCLALLEAGAGRCKSLPEHLLTFVQWVYTTAQLDAAAHNLGLHFLARKQTNLALARLRQVTCDGETILVDPVDQYQAQPVTARRT